jgi:hypothetical protein
MSCYFEKTADSSAALRNDNKSGATTKKQTVQRQKTSGAATTKGRL